MATDHLSLPAVWKLGAVGGTFVFGSVAGLGVLVALPAVFVADALGRDEMEALVWVALAAPIWAPVAIGEALRRLDETRQAKH